jgi:Ca-activated chloride channel family protein
MEFAINQTTRIGAQKRDFVRIFVGAAIALAAAAPSKAQQPMFRGDTQVVALSSTVTDAQNRMVPNLTRDDFEVLDNDKPQPLTVFDAAIEPITAVVMLDTSASMGGTLRLLRSAAREFVNRLLPADTCRVGAFNEAIQLSPRFTSDHDELVADIGDLDTGNTTRLYDALAASLDALRSVEGRRVILVLTDGADTDSKASLRSVITRARTEGVMVYAIGLDRSFNVGKSSKANQLDRGLKKLAEETGGGYFELEKTGELGVAFARVADELHSQYVLGFSPGRLDGRLHKLVVRVKQPGMTPRARRSYVAAPDIPATHDQ